MFSDSRDNYSSHCYPEHKLSAVATDSFTRAPPQSPHWSAVAEAPVCKLLASSAICIHFSHGHRRTCCAFGESPSSFIFHEACCMRKGRPKESMPFALGHKRESMSFIIRDAIHLSHQWYFLEQFISHTQPTPLHRKRFIV